VTPVTYKSTITLSPKIYQNKFNVILNGNNFVNFKNLSLKEYERYNHFNQLKFIDKENLYDN